MQSGLGEALRSATERGAVVFAFTCYDLETAQGVLSAARLRATPVILLVSQTSLSSEGGDEFVAAMCAVARRSPVDAYVQLDHVNDLVLVERAFALGVDAVMADGSQLPFEENVAFVRDAMRMALPSCGLVEAELGRVEGDEDSASPALHGQLTDPTEASDFASQTNVGCLAVSIGNVHGHYVGTPELDWERLSLVRAAVTVPLSLHGASGLHTRDLERAVSLGIAKVNVNTELRRGYFDATAAALPEVSARLELGELHRRQADAVKAIVSSLLANWS